MLARLFFLRAEAVVHLGGVENEITFRVDLPDGKYRLAVTIGSELRTHLDLEDRHLVPVVLECLGERAAADLSREHAEQRALLECVLGRLRCEARLASVTWIACERS